MVSTQISPSQRKIFDAHVHVEEGLEAYDLPVVAKNIIFNHVGSYRERVHSCRLKNDAVTLIVDNGPDFDFVRGEAEAGRIDALKIHSRISKLAAGDWPSLLDRLRTLPPALPIVVDAFYYGGELQYQPALSGIVNLLSSFPDRKIVMAHSGGYRILEYFFHLREFKNCYYELALTLQYLEDSSVSLDIKKLINFTDKSKILYGSDFPFASPARQYAIALDIFNTLSLSEHEIDQIMYANSATVFAKLRPK